MKTKTIALTALGIALYIVMSLTLKIPLVGHISVDLGYIALAVYCYHFGYIIGAIVGSCGCALMSTLVYGMFPPGWFVGNIIIGTICGLFYYRNGRKRLLKNILITVVTVFVGVALTKTIMECMIFDIPFAVKFPKNCVAFVCDAVAMSIGAAIAPKVPISKYII